jgi:hypothetical protein
MKKKLIRYRFRDIYFKNEFAKRLSITGLALMYLLGIMFLELKYLDIPLYGVGDIMVFLILTIGVVFIGVVPIGMIICVLNNLFER